jgi:hypothetical protein
MDRIKNVVVNDIDVSFIYQTADCKEAALLRKKLMTGVYSYTIDQVSYEALPDIFNPEKLSLRLGQLIPKQLDSVGYIDVKGPKMITCEDIQGIEFVYNMPLIYIDKDEELKCKIMMKKDCGATHAKWNPVVAIKYVEHEEGFLFSFELTGLLTVDELLAQL